MTIAVSLKGIEQLYIDTSPFIYFVEQHPTYIDLVREVFGRIHSKHLNVTTSAITLTEVLTMPIEKQQTHYQAEYRDMLLNTEGVTLLPVSITVAEQAAHLRAKYRLRTPDALHVATALEAQCQAFLTNDFGLKRIEEIKILVFKDL